MRRPWLLLIGMILAAPSIAAAADDAYGILGEMAVQHEGRVKPIDTFAHQMVKQVYTREVINLKDAKGKTIATWQSLPAYIDWQARPDFWNAQEILAVEYPPLRQKLLAGPAREALKALADSGKLSAEDKARVAKAAAVVRARGLMPDHSIRFPLWLHRLHGNVHEQAHFMSRSVKRSS